MPFAILLLALLAVSCGPASAQQSNAFSANALLSACRNFAENSSGPPEPEMALKEGVCLGFFSTLLGYGAMLDPSLRFCPPKNVTSKDAMRLVIRGLESQPELLQEDLRNVIVSVLRYAWPCNR